MIQIHSYIDILNFQGRCNGSYEGSFFDLFLKCLLNLLSDLVRSSHMHSLLVKPIVIVVAFLNCYFKKTCMFLLKFDRFEIITQNKPLKLYEFSSLLLSILNRLQLSLKKLNLLLHCGIQVKVPLISQC